MPEEPKKLGIFTGRGWLIVLAVAVGLVLGMGPTSAQFFNFGGYQQRPQPQRGGGWFGNEQRGGGWFGNDTYAPYQQQYAPPRHGRQAPPASREDFSKAPPPEKRNTAPERHILVLGDSMADWLAYGLEDVYADQPEMGVVRKHKTASGLIKYQPKGNPADWAAAAKGILATEKADAIVVMLGLDDRVAIREPAADKSDNRPGDKKDAKAKPDGKPSGEKLAAKPDGAAKVADPELPPDDAADSNGARPVTGPEKSAGSPNDLHEFREKRWVELYREKIDEMIGVLKSKGVPVLWVGLPAVRGAKATSDTAFLDTLYRDAAGKAGITYVDAWDGFVDEAGRFLQQGPDFEGQIRKLRSADGVYFTRAGALKLAHYAERELNRLLAARSAPIVLPTEPATPDANARPDQPARPLAGPIVPLVASSVGTDQLLGAPGSRQVAIDAQAARLLINGEPLPAPAGRADDFAWPRREIGREGAKGETPMASASLGANARAQAASPKPKKHRR
jgi:uncharacterized protein